MTTLTDVPRARCEECGWQSRDLDAARIYGHTCPAVMFPSYVARLRAKGNEYAGIMWMMRWRGLMP